MHALHGLTAAAPLYSVDMEAFSAQADLLKRFWFYRFECCFDTTHGYTDAPNYIELLAVQGRRIHDQSFRRPKTPSHRVRGLRLATTFSVAASMFL